MARQKVTNWSSRVDPLIRRYRGLVPLIAQEDATLAVDAVGRMIVAVEKAKSVPSSAATAVAEDAILEAGRLLEAVRERRQAPEA
ncbi:MAG: hypothetical protein DMF80_10655 [Acidobacteria bacterium]|nr:MAG: hypothetical protein DMF80_10655 [Acidobacteriota bacterium]PYQ23798.1 MAG: hypothetical protein DMF81_07565 [Acidobacteriota bacterium]